MRIYASNQTTPDMSPPYDAWSTSQELSNIAHCPKSLTRFDHKVETYATLMKDEKKKREEIDKISAFYKP